MIHITYRVETTARGLIVWRSVPGQKDTAVGLTPARARLFRTEKDADDEIEVQVRADRAAGTRLGVPVSSRRIHV